MTDAAVYAVQFPATLCACGLPLSSAAKSKINKRAQRLAALGAPAPSRAPAPAFTPAPAPAPENPEVEFLRTLRTELEGLSPDERDALREVYQQQADEAHRALSTAMRTLALIDAFIEAHPAVA